MVVNKLCNETLMLILTCVNNFTWQRIIFIFLEGPPSRPPPPSKEKIAEAKIRRQISAR